MVILLTGSQNDFNVANGAPTFPRVLLPQLREYYGAAAEDVNLSVAADGYDQIRIEGPQ